MLVGRLSGMLDSGFDRHVHCAWSMHLVRFPILLSQISLMESQPRVFTLVYVGALQN